MDCPPCLQTGIFWIVYLIATLKTGDACVIDDNIYGSMRADNEVSYRLPVMSISNIKANILRGHAKLARGFAP